MITMTMMVKMGPFVHNDPATDRRYRWRRHPPHQVAIHAVHPNNGGISAAQVPTKLHNRPT
jgi:hypothetical protein